MTIQWLPQRGALRMKCPTTRKAAPISLRSRRSLSMRFFSLVPLLLFFLACVALLHHKSLEFNRLMDENQSKLDLPHKSGMPVNKIPSKEQPPLFLQGSQENNSSTTPFNCGCVTCGSTALSFRNPKFPFSCRQRIRYLMKTHSQSKENACSMAATELSCGNECNPAVCDKQFDASIVKLPPSHTGPVKLMVIATVPKDHKHAVALWTELECLTGGIDVVVLSAPDWCRDLIEYIASKARSELELDLDTRYYTNDRYDAGLWCDTLQDIRGTFRGSSARSADYESIVLLNDSIFAMRPFTGIQDRLAQSSGNLDVVSLSSSTTPGGGVDPTNVGGNPWIESVLRGFNGASIHTFMQHVCEASRVEKCISRKRSPQKRRRCIVEATEVAIAHLYNPDRVVGLYPSYPPDGFPNTFTTWVQNEDFWRDILVKQLDFPVAKVNRPRMISRVTDARLKKCTRFMDHDFLFRYNYTSLQEYATLTLHKVHA